MNRGSKLKAKQLFAALGLTAFLSIGAKPLLAQSSVTGPDFGVAVQSLGNIQAALADIHDNNNRKVGDVQHLFINPLSGAIEQVGIQFDIDSTDRTRLFLVPWNQFTVTQRNNGALALILDQVTIDRLRLTGSTAPLGAAPSTATTGTPPSTLPSATTPAPGAVPSNQNFQSGGTSSGSNQPGSVFGR
jgi:hypothetical protein